MIDQGEEMAKTIHDIGTATYWKVWGVLLLITLVMMLIDTAELARTVLVLLLLVGMLAKASLIGAYFMHLRFEKLSLVGIVAAGIFFTGAALFFLIASDGLWILKLAAK
jgi:cytochrome c oxidase subunit IV